MTKFTNDLLLTAIILITLLLLTSGIQKFSRVVFTSAKNEKAVKVSL